MFTTTKETKPTSFQSNHKLFLVTTSPRGALEFTATLEEGGIRGLKNQRTGTIITVRKIDWYRNALDTPTEEMIGDITKGRTRPPNAVPVSKVSI